LAQISARCAKRLPMRLLARLPAPFCANVVAPVVVLFIVISESRRLVVIALVLLDDLIEPLSDRQAGLARGFACGFARFWTKTSEIPRTAGFHCAPNHFGRSEMALL